MAVFEGVLTGGKNIHKSSRFVLLKKQKTKHINIEREKIL